METLKLALSNLKYILCNGDITVLRFLLGIGSLIWAAWAAVVVIPLIELHTFIIHLAPLWAWGALFFIHGIWALERVLLKLPVIGASIVCSMLGVVLWTGSAIIIFETRLATGILPMGGAHELAVIIAWWIFFDSLRKYGKIDDPN